MNATTRSYIAALAVLGATTGLVAPAATAAGARQISGVGLIATADCPAMPPAGFESYTDLPPIQLTGSLEGCLYIDVQSDTDQGAPSGVFRERGSEVFVGSLDGGQEGTFTTRYLFTSKWDPDISTGSQVNGRCQHPIVAGSGTGGFAGATGRMDFKDDVDAGVVHYRGHIKVG